MASNTSVVLEELTVSELVVELEKRFKGVIIYGYTPTQEGNPHGVFCYCAGNYLIKSGLIMTALSELMEQFMKEGRRDMPNGIR